MAEGSLERIMSSESGMGVRSEKRSLEECLPMVGAMVLVVSWSRRSVCGTGLSNKQVSEQRRPRWRSTISVLTLSPSGGTKQQ